MIRVQSSAYILSLKTKEAWDRRPGGSSVGLGTSCQQSVTISKYFNLDNSLQTINCSGKSLLIAIKILIRLHLSKNVRSSTENVQFWVNFSGGMKITPSRGCPCTYHSCPCCCRDIKKVSFIWITLDVTIIS